MTTSTEPAFPLRRALVAVFILHIVAISGVVSYGWMHRRKLAVAPPPAPRQENRPRAGDGASAEKRSVPLPVSSLAASTPARPKDAGKPKIPAEDRTRSELASKQRRKATRPQDLALQLIQGDNLTETKPAPKKP